MTFDLGQVFEVIFNTIVDLASSINMVFTWLTEEQEFGFELLGGFIGLKLMPITLIGGAGILILLALWLIKALVPFG